MGPRKQGCPDIKEKKMPSIITSEAQDKTSILEQEDFTEESSR